MKPPEYNPDFTVISSYGNGTIRDAKTCEDTVMPFNHDSADPRYPGNTAASTNPKGL